MIMLLALFVGVFSHPNRIDCRDPDEGGVAALTQDQDLVDALAPFTVAAAGDDVSALFSTTDFNPSLPPSDDAASATSCRFRKLSRKWPHNNAENNEDDGAIRRLLRRGGGGHKRHGNVAFDVDNTLAEPFSPLQRYRRRRRKDVYTCLNEGTVKLAFKDVQFVLKKDEVVEEGTDEEEGTGEEEATGEGEDAGEGEADSSEDTAETNDGGPRRELRRGNRDSGDSADHEPYDPTATLPYAILTLTQTNDFVDDQEPVQFDITLTCKAMYRSENDVCVHKGFDCYDGEYSYYYTDSGDADQTQEMKEKKGFGMKCSHVADFFPTWDECAWPAEDDATED